MINGVKSAAISNTYANNVAKNGKDVTKGANETKNTTAQSKTETLKEQDRS